MMTTEGEEMITKKLIEKYKDYEIGYFGIGKDIYERPSEIEMLTPELIRKYGFFPFMISNMNHTIDGKYGLTLIQKSKDLNHPMQYTYLKESGDFIPFTEFIERGEYKFNFTIDTDEFIDYRNSITNADEPLAFNNVICVGVRRGKRGSNNMWDYIIFRVTSVRWETLRTNKRFTIEPLYTL